MDIESKVCLVCLSCETDLWPLGEYMDLYKMLLGKENDLENTDMKPFTCSDCQDMFHKIQMFQQKILSSQEILLSKSKRNPQLSGDRIDFKNEFDSYHSDDNEIEIETGFFDENAECKDEPFDNDSIDHNYDVDDNLIAENIKEEPIEDIEDASQFKIEDVKQENEEDTKLKKKEKNYYPRGKNVRFNLISGADLLKRNSNYRYYIKRLSDKDVKEKAEEARLAWIYRKSKFKCRGCVRGFKENDNLLKHIEKKHSESIGPYVCDVCEIRSPSKESLERHVREHYYNHECILCGATHHKKWHLRMHFILRHKKLYECPDCGIVITHRREYYRHYRLMHQRFICDHCGKVYKDRHWFENHILKVHTKYECKICNKTFAYFRNYDCHNKLLHTEAASESTYCVECDIQFENRPRYNRHISTSTRHLGRRRKKSANCPECGKLYVCRNNMMNHYRLVHLKVTNYQCQDCSRFFLNSYRLKEHRLVKHEKKGRAKNKICSYCGRGFSNNRILLYHVRTHTGERPHACEHCSATFAQPFALATHIKARHKEMLK